MLSGGAEALFGLVSVKTLLTFGGGSDACVDASTYVFVGGSGGGGGRGGVLAFTPRSSLWIYHQVRLETLLRGWLQEWLLDSYWSLPPC